RSETLGRVSHDVLKTVHPTTVEEAKDTLLREGRWEGELVHTRKDGSAIRVASRWVAQMENDRPVAILETNTDVTRRREAEEGLARSEELYRTIVSTAGEGVWLIDRRTQTVYANDRMAAI